MAKNWAIAIGINQYDFLPPLQYAKQDALSVQTFLQQEGGFERIFFFSDDSPSLNGKSTYPSRANLLRVLRQIFKQPFMGAGDSFWFFFSGHGTRHSDRDYLMPVDGDPEDVENTGIAIHYISEHLRRSGADNVVLILDACRNQSTRTGEGMGHQTAAIARQTGVISIFSCSPNEYSYELHALQQGSFTHALLASLGPQGNCATVECVDRYLTHRVPELNAQHGKPCQTPYTVAEPISRRHLILLPRWATAADIALLKNDAYRVTQIDGNLELAEQLWIRVLTATSGQDMEAVRALQRIAQLQLETAPPDGGSTSQQAHQPLGTINHAPPGEDGPVEVRVSERESPPAALAATLSAPAMPTNSLGKSWAKSWGKPGQVMLEHDDRVQAVAIAPTGDLLASGGVDRAVRLWNMATGQPQRVLWGHLNAVQAIAFSPDRRALASGGGDNAIRLWNYHTGQVQQVLVGHSGWILAIAFSPDGQLLVSASADSSLKLWDCATGQERYTLTGHLGWVAAVALSPDGQRLASGSHDHTVKVWSVSSGTLLFTLTGHQATVSALAFSPNSKTLISASHDGTLKFWQAKQGKLCRTLAGHPSPISALAFSPNSQTLISASTDGTLKRWAMGRDKPQLTLTGHSGAIRAIAFSPNGRILASASHDHTVRLWAISPRANHYPAWVACAALLLGLVGLQFFAFCESRTLTWAACSNQHPFIQLIRQPWQPHSP